MKTRESVKLVGNFNRLKEMADADVHPLVISTHCKVYGVHVEESDVEVLIRCSESMKQNIIPKKPTRGLVKDALANPRPKSGE